MLDVDLEVWTHKHTELIRTAAQDPAVTRILVNAAIKKALCREAGADRTWLFKVRPWYGHAEHFHIQIACPAAAWNASHSPRRSQATAAVTGSRIRRCIQRRRPNRNRR